MKNTIPSDVWEEKKALIATLYKDEEWPLKQVIKKIRSDNFNPSETQLRSRLKKWRVTKPSRQTRKKSHEETSEEGSLDKTPPTHRSNKSSPRTQTPARPQPTTATLPVTEPEWYMTNGGYAQHGLPTTISFDGRNIPCSWAPVSGHASPLSSPSKSRVNSHGSLVISTSSSYDTPTSPLVDGALLYPTPALTPTFSDPPYPITTDSCLPTPVSATTAAPPVQWSMPQWYPMPMETSTGAALFPYYTTGTLTPPMDPTMHMMPPQHMSEFHEGLKQWKRNMSVPYGPEATTAHINRARQQPSKLLERKTSLPSKITAGQPCSGVVTPTSPFFPPGQHPVICSPGYTYSGS